MLGLSVDHSAAEVGIRTPVIGVIEGVAALPTEGTSLDAKLSRLEADLDNVVLKAERSGVPAGFRELFKKLGYPEQTTSPERLRDAVRRSGLKRINVIVDACNLVSLALGTPIGAHDFDMLDENIRITRAANSTRFLPLFHDKEKTIPVGDLVYHADGRMLCWMGKRDVDAHAFRIRESTTGVLVMAIGNAGTSFAFNELVCMTAFEFMREPFPDAHITLFRGEVGSGAFAPGSAVMN